MEYLASQEGEGVESEGEGGAAAAGRAQDGEQRIVGWSCDLEEGSKSSKLLTFVFRFGQGIC